MRNFQYTNFRGGVRWSMRDPIGAHRSIDDFSSRDHAWQADLVTSTWSKKCLENH